MNFIKTSKMCVAAMLLLFCSVTSLRADLQERLIYTTNFQDWEVLSSGTEATIVNKTTSFSNEELTFTFQETSVEPLGFQEIRFCYVDGSGKGLGPFTNGYVMAAKSATSYIETSILKNVKRVSFVHGATGGNRGWKLLKKGASDANWVVLSDAVANPATGVKVECEVNEDNVALRFENITDNQNAYMSELNIYANVDITTKQVVLTTATLPVEAGSVTVSPISTSYDEGYTIKLNASRNFGYKFTKWVDGSGNTLSTDATFDYVINNDVTITAVYEALTTYSFSCEAKGTEFGRFEIEPEANNGRYEAGTVVSVVPHSNEIMTFLMWEDGTTENSRLITINNDTEITGTWSEVDYIVGWDFFKSGNSDLAGQFYSETSNTGIFSCVKLGDGTTKAWLEKSGATTSEGKNCATIWSSEADLGNYGYQASFGTKNATDIRLKFDIANNGYATYSKQLVQYSIDGATFVNVDTVTFESQKTWVSTETSLPSECEGLDKIYVRWIADKTSPVLGSGNDGTSISNIFVLAKKEDVADTLAPVLLSTTPVKNGKNASASGSVILTFDEKVEKGAGDVTLNGNVLTGTMGSSSAVFSYSGLNYATTYEVVVPAGAIVDRSGNAFAGTTFSFTTMEKKQPTAKLFDAVVAADGSGDYLTVNEAIAAAPKTSKVPYLIFIKEGYYKEHLQIDGQNIHLIGQSADKVTITDNRLSGSTNDADAASLQQNCHVSVGASVVVNGSDFFAEGISFENEWGVTKLAGPQALALYTANDRAILNKCKLRSYQDTYLSSNRHYLKNCFIEGAVDFIYGSGDVYFDACSIYINRTSGGYITAPNHDSSTKWGYIFMNNTIDAPTASSVYFGRPWHNSPKVSFVNTTLSDNITIYAAGWYQTMGAIPAIFADYNTMDSKGNPVDLSNRNDYYYYTDSNTGNKVEGTAKKSLTAEEVAQYTIANVLSGSDNWQPTEAVEPCNSPKVQTTATGIKWDAVPYAICYVITVDGKVVGFTTSTTYEVSGGKNVSVQAANEHGSLSEASFLTTSAKKKIDSKVNLFGAENRIIINGVNGQSNVEVFNFGGQKLSRLTINGDYAMDMPRGIYIVKVTSGEQLTVGKVFVR